MTPQPQSSRRPASGFTLTELLVVIAIILVLVALIMPAVTLLRHRACATSTRATIDGLVIAMEAYSGEERKRRYPPPQADKQIAYDANGVEKSWVGNLLESAGLAVTRKDLDMANGGHVIVDGWYRPILYVLDDDMDGTADKPAPQDDWNARGSEPFAYVWSLGRPRSKGDAVDADPANADRWIYRANSK